MRKSTHIVFFLIAMTAGANMFVASGAASDLGIAPQPGQDQLIKTVEESDDVQNPNPGGGGGETLFGLFTSAAGIINSIYRIVFAADIMFRNIGVPRFITDGLFRAVPFIVALDLLYVFTGRDT